MQPRQPPISTQLVILMAVSIFMHLQKFMILADVALVSIRYTFAITLLVYAFSFDYCFGVPNIDLLNQSLDGI